MDLPATVRSTGTLERSRAPDALLGQTQPQQEERRAGQQERANCTRAGEENPHSAADAHRRLMQDLKRIQCASNSHFSARPVDGDLFHWRAIVLGPDSTVWEGGIFKLQLNFTVEYPCAPPKVRFLTKDMFHPNVYVDGNICLDTLKSCWSPIIDVESLLMMVISLLSDPNPNSAANGEAASLYTNARDKYDERVRRLVEASLEQSFSDAEDE
ncbi:ubiquitin-conjugating enzyme E2 [Trypanosoma rangeli]|uniref:Ubiquitin-conjugating enzyme E2 n=1 Tax=Trypanosoma rangeli TaxID=5698 RepID=A0A422NDI3_TRYRA|nr:ubiquitin-conjugating enzyme E2 [Trypanosoma rangeli]RNF03547.1 ubiquitin-conjugating enzyme E2 [Trypanosoma rangeli]|eukprot:RNF03547.1 ubiquitin-conjugating enzyme E2 [Trypanosoma rangeli]